MSEGNVNLSVSLINGSVIDKSQISILNRSKENFFSKLFFWSIVPLIKVIVVIIKQIKLSAKSDLESSMIEDLDIKQKSEEQYAQFDKIYRFQRDKPYGLTRALILKFKGSLLQTILLVFIQMSLQTMVPLIVYEVIKYLQNPERKIIEGLLWVCVIFFSRFFILLCQSHATRIIVFNLINGLFQRRIGLDCISVLSMALFVKFMKVSFQSNKKHKMGEVINLMQVDIQRLEQITLYLTGILLMPIQICNITLVILQGVSVYLLFVFIGVSALGGLGVIFVSAMLNYLIGRFCWVFQKKMMLQKDLRTKYTNELFTCIKFIKINALEEYFISKVQAVRTREIMLNLKYNLTHSCSIFSLWLSPMLILVTTFGIYLSLGNDLTTANTFTILSIFLQIQDPLRSLPQFISALIQASISLNRISSFLQTDELMIKCLNNSCLQSDFAIEIQNGDFQWKRQNDVEAEDMAYETNSKSKIFLVNEKQGQQTSTLKQINLKIPKGAFISIIGDVGSGKSSLVQALLGEMIYQEAGELPQITINGSIAYVSQRAWIQNCSVRDNILFGSPYHEVQYLNAIRYSCLEQDIAILINGDQTMIGERGVNLSGGQKARISLARAIYSESDIYLLDDPIRLNNYKTINISAVDVHVAKYIIHECLNEYLRFKTRILITHAVNYCRYTDYIYLMENGSIIERGTFDQIKDLERFQIIQKKFNKDSLYQDLEDENVHLNSDTDLRLNQTDEDEEQIKINHQQNDQLEENIDQNKEDLVDDLMLQEDRCKGNVTLATFKQFFKMIGGYYFIGYLATMVIGQAICQIVSTLWIANWTQQSDQTTHDIDNSYYLKVYSVFALGFGIFAFGRGCGISISTNFLSKIIHEKMLNCISYAPQCDFFERVPLGRIMNRFTKDQSVLDSELMWYISSFSISFSLLIGELFLNIYSSSSFIILPTISFFIVSYFIQRKYLKASRELFRLERISKSPILSYFQESISGLTIIRGFQRQQTFIQNHANNLNLNRKLLMKQIDMNIWFQFILTLLSFTVNISAIIVCIFQSSDNPGLAGVLMTYASQINDNILGTLLRLGSVETNIISFERCHFYTSIQPEKAYEQLVNNKQKQQICKEKQNFVPNWPTEGNIQIHDLSVRYRPNLPFAINKISLNIKSKEKIGIVGRTGAGKSSITLALLRILEANEGQLIIDGVDISTLSLKQLRESITMIMQDTSIFEGTIRSNIDPLNLHSQEEVLTVIQQCCLNEILEERDGLQTWVNEQGDNLSAGEKQLICIARAILKQSKIILIDEATANIDIETEQKIQEALRKSFNDCTVIKIAHRVNTILHCDKILVLNEGRVQEFDETQKLLSDTKSMFYSIFQESLRNQQEK